MSTRNASIQQPLPPLRVDTGIHIAPFPVTRFPHLCAQPDGHDQADRYHGQLSHTSGEQPTLVAQYALLQWNAYLMSQSVASRTAFLELACWLLEHETRIGDDAGGWPISNAARDADLWLSATTQGNALSVTVRAYALTREPAFLELARRIVRTFERDILDGGVNTPFGDEGLFFEERAVYPAAHTLSGCLFGLLALYDYASLTDVLPVEQLLRRGLSALHTFLGEFDLGFWTRADLLRHDLTSRAELELQAQLLAALAARSDCAHCARLAIRWQDYLCQSLSGLRSSVVRWRNALRHTLMRRIRARLFPAREKATSFRVCIPITAFPVIGGMRTVISRIAQVTSDIWNMEYLARHVGPHQNRFVIHSSQMRGASPWRFPGIWLYELAGAKKLLTLMRQGAPYQLLLPQDGVGTAAFAAFIGKLAGVRCVCIDHGNLGVLQSRLYRTERVQAWEDRSRFERLLIRLQYIGYWPSLHLLAWLSARLVDHYFIPGAPGDGVETLCARLGVPASHITRFANMIDIEHFPCLDEQTRANQRQRYSIAAEATVIAILCRLEADKGLEVALEAIERAITRLDRTLQASVSLLIAGDGSLRPVIEEELHKRGLWSRCLFWGEASTEEVPLLLGMSDIFLYTSWRAAGYPLTILEAMASRCAVIASTEPLANTRMLADGRGIVVPVGATEQMSDALVRLVSDTELRWHMGQSARTYVAQQHNAEQFRRALLRVTSWSGLPALLCNSPERNGSK